MVREMKKNRRRPIIGITMGDPAGIGPEIIVKTLSLEEVYDECRPFVIGDGKVIDRAKSTVNSYLKTRLIQDVGDAEFAFGNIDIYDLENVNIENLNMGEVQEEAGKASVEYVFKAVELAVKNEIDAVTTAPINKEAMNKAGFKYAGHTEIIAELTETENYAMMLIAGNLRVIHVTTHVSLKEALGLITKERVFNTIRLADTAMRNLGYDKPKIGVAGLNPHAGDGGIFGREEIDIIALAISMAEKQGMNVHGPFSPDTVFLRTNNEEFDVAVAMYHDQGHIAVKMMGLSKGVNYTVGLPIIRTSVDHGTAYDIAKFRPGTADPDSLIEAVKLAVKLSEKTG
jgi:4-hydroxythreonine-4-phosphate dehydrogenase